MANNAVGIIEQINASSNLYNIASTAYGYCTTAAGTAEKAVTIAGFKYIDGVTIHVKFRYANTAANPQLNVNSEGAKPIVLAGATEDVATATVAGTSNTTTGWNAGAVVSFTYDGTNWIRDQGYNTDGGGTVTSVRVQATSPVVSSQNTAQSGTLDTTISLANGYGDTKNPYGTKTANTVLAGPSSGSAAAPSFRSLVAADIPNISTSKLTDGILGVARGGTGVNTLASGEVLIGNGTSAVTTKAIDTTVTANSTNLITSGAVSSALAGLSGAMHFIGITTTALTDGANTTTLAGTGLSKTTGFVAGDVVIYSDSEFVWTGSSWERLGRDSSWALDSAVVHKSDFTAKGQLLKGTGNGTYDTLAPNTDTTGKVLYMASSTAAWKQLGITTTGHTAKAVTAVAYTANTGSWSTLNKGSGVSISGVGTAGTPTDATVTNAVLVITKGTATTKATAQTVPKLADLSLSDGAWPTLNVTKTTDFLTGAEISYT